MHIIDNPIVPLTTPIYEGWPHEAKIEIHADTFQGPNQGFVIEFPSKHGIAMHLNARQGLMGDFVLVINNFEHGHWHREERHCNPFGGHFHLKIKNHHNHFAIHVNGRHICHFHHREKPHHIHAMTIRGDIQIEKIHFERFHHHNGGGLQVGGGAYPVAPIPPSPYAPAPPVVYQQSPQVMMAPPPVVVFEEGHHHHHRHHHGVLHNLLHPHHHHHHC